MVVNFNNNCKLGMNKIRISPNVNRKLSKFDPLLSASAAARAHMIIEISEQLTA